jgi:hypothetical protein
MINLKSISKINPDRASMDELLTDLVSDGLFDKDVIINTISIEKINVLTQLSLDIYKFFDTMGPLGQTAEGLIIAKGMLVYFAVIFITKLHLLDPMFYPDICKFFIEQGLGNEPAKEYLVKQLCILGDNLIAQGMPQVDVNHILNSYLKDIDDLTRRIMEIETLDELKIVLGMFDSKIAVLFKTSAIITRKYTVVL